MNKLANKKFFETKEAIRQSYVNLKNELRNLVLLRAKEKTIYLPLEDVALEVGKSPYYTTFAAKIFLNSDDEMCIESYKHDGENDARFSEIPLNQLGESLQRIILESVDEDTLERQDLLRSEYKVLKCSFDYFLVDNRLRHALAGKINNEYIANSEILGAKFHMEFRPNIFYKVELDFEWFKYYNALRVKLSGSDTYHSLNELPIDTLKWINKNLWYEAKKRKEMLES